MIHFTEEQRHRLAELGAEAAGLEASFEDVGQRNQAFQQWESRLVSEQQQRLERWCAEQRRPFILELEERLAAALRAEGFLQMHTPLIISRKRLEKMGVFSGSIMEKQVFWLDDRRCLRPMLAPNLYECMRELGRLRPRPLRLFEIGPCFRRETQGQRHANEFTMLNLVEMGVPEGEDLRERLLRWGRLVLDTAGITGWRMVGEESSVYGETDDFVDANGMEHQRGMKAMTIPAHQYPGCRDVLVKCIKFVLPEDLDVSGGSPNALCNARNLKAHLIAHNIDTDYRCCLSQPTP